MSAPVFSTVSLFGEIVLTGIVLYTFYSGSVKNIFPRTLAFGAMIYEAVVNISYMASRTASSIQVRTSTPSERLLAAFHGILSLFMFIALIIYFTIAAAQYKKNINFFAKHKILNAVFLLLWFLSVGSGIYFYMVKYVF